MLIYVWYFSSDSSSLVPWSESLLTWSSSSIYFLVIIVTSYEICILSLSSVSDLSNPKSSISFLFLFLYPCSNFSVAQYPYLRLFSLVNCTDLISLIRFFVIGFIILVFLIRNLVIDIYIYLGSHILLLQIQWFVFCIFIYICRCNFEKWLRKPKHFFVINIVTSVQYVTTRITLFTFIANCCPRTWNYFFSMYKFRD